MYKEIDERRRGERGMLGSWYAVVYFLCLLQREASLMICMRVCFMLSLDVSSYNLQPVHFHILTSCLIHYRYNYEQFRKLYRNIFLTTYIST